MLKIVSTPIGNLKDITLRAIEALREADAIVAEDTREVIKLLRHFEIPQKPLISFYEEVEVSKINDVLALAREQNVVLVSDAGTPLISDPGYKLVREAIKQGVQVDAVPGPCAAIDALVLSGLPPDKFTYWGFFNKKINSNEGTNIYYVSPHRLLKFLVKLDQNLEIVIARELTKLYQEVWHGKVSDA
ncbi:MAG: 16S rRNA (cytidine(1402)-2'-O)-methyltransferase, partial [bacterium]|nr:16S rRNA (cytidine(1402)-2'-O)-methyltransferase [bacterium]